MATRSVSPGAALLRASRMFSIPAPLPRTGSDLSSSVTFGSDTATAPHPTHLTITTPPSSLSRGDWGLKRPLPLRATTKSSTPLLRVEKVDTWEHTTEFASAADHALTLQKWQELNMPLSTPSLPDNTATSYLNKNRKPTRSVFDEDLDATTKSKAGSEDSRWKFEGPWVPGQTDGEFNEYVSKEVRRRRPEFRQYLCKQKALEKSRIARAIAAEKGEAPAPDVQAADITEEEMQQYLRELRQERSALYRHIRAFLDLPPTPSAKTMPIDDYLEQSFGPSFLSQDKNQTRTIDSKDYMPTSNSPYAATGPPKTHPSAGLSYLRTSSYIYNHPVYGPQANPPPVQGRVIQPKAAAVGAFSAKLGVAGIVTDVPLGHDISFKTSSSRRGEMKRDSISGILMIEPDKVGGSKVYLQPRHANIDSKGMISLSVDVAQPAAVAVHEGLEDTPAPLAQRPSSNQPVERPTSTTTSGYGLTSNSFENRARVTEESRWGNVAARATRSEGSDREALDSLQALLALSEVNKKTT